MNIFRKIRTFYIEMMAELKKASWPTRPELRDSSIAVIIAMALLGIYIALIDFSLFEVVDLFTGLVRG
ncbi:MAG: preprotein translocase subunit SecE [Opitutales bacterium]